MGADLLELYDEERRLYYRYRKVATGADLVLSNARISERKVIQAQNEWYAALRRLTNAGGTTTVMRRLLRERAGYEEAS